jgi:putative peptidoglycan lipid II flippase
MRLLAASMVFMALAGLLMGVLNAYRRFVAPTLTPLAFNGVIIIGVIASGTTLGIQGLALASLLAAVSTVLIQIPRLPWDRLRYQARIYGHDPAVQRFAHLVGPLILGTLILNATGVIDRMVASGLPEGSLAALDFGLRTTGVAWVMVPALGTVLLPTLSALAAQREWEGFAVRLGSGLRVLILFLVPASALFILLAEPITRVLFQRGAFDVHSTRMTSGALAWYAAGLVSYGLYYLYITAFYALQNTMVRVRAGLILVSAYLVTVVALVHVMGVNALALGYGMGHTVAWLYLARTMQRRVPGVWGTVVPALPQIAAATVPMALAVFFLQAALHNPLMGSFLFTVGALVMVGGLAALVYGGTLWLLGNRDLRALPSLLAR